MTITAANCSLDSDAELECTLAGFEGKKVSARILTGEVHTFNDFDAPERVTIHEHEASVSGGVLRSILPINFKRRSQCRVYD